MCFEYHRVIFHWKKLVKIFENIIWSQKYFTPPSFVTNSIFTPEFFQWILCLERVVLESDTTLCRVKFEEARFLPNVVKKIEKELPYVIMRRKDGITQYINGSLSIRFKSKAQCIIDQYNNYKVGNLSVNGINTQVTFFTFTYTFCLLGHCPNSFWPSPPCARRAVWGIFYPNIIGSQKVTMVEPNFLQNLISLKQNENIITHHHNIMTWFSWDRVKILLTLEG